METETETERETERDCGLSKTVERKRESGGGGEEGERRERGTSARGRVPIYPSIHPSIKRGT
jgi:hypothetical protein